jgi:hypothetical protein
MLGEGRWFVEGVSVYVAGWLGGGVGLPGPFATEGAPVRQGRTRAVSPPGLDETLRLGRHKTAGQVWSFCVSEGGLEPPRPLKGTSTSS